MDKFRAYAMKPSWLNFQEFDTPQQQGEDKPPAFIPLKADDVVIDLPDFDFEYLDTYEAIRTRSSVRKYKEDHMTMEVLSYFLKATLGMREDDIRFRMSPSGGARHAIETYIYADRIEGLEEGLYRYHVPTHQLVLIHNETMASHHIKGFMFNAPCCFMWTAVPYRMYWRYKHCAEKIILLDAGHVCQNLYLVAESIGYGACAVGAYDQDKMDNFMKLDGEKEFLIYAAPVGLK